MAECNTCGGYLSIEDKIRPSMKCDANGNVVWQGALLNQNEPEVDAYISGLTTPLSSGQIDKLNTFVAAIKTGLGISALSDAFDVMRILAGETEESSLKNLVKNAHHATKVNSPTFTQFEGFTGNATSSCLKDNYIPSTDALRFTLNNASFGVYGLREVAAGAKSIIGYTSSGLSSSGLQTKVTSTIIRYTINSNRIVSAINSTVLSAVNQGLHIVNRVASNQVQYYRNKNLMSNIELNSEGLLNYSTSVLANGAAIDIYSAFSDEQAAFEFWGKGLTQGEINVITDAIEAYMDSNGKGVIA